jgi:hypothetical protein
VSISKSANKHANKHTHAPRTPSFAIGLVLVIDMNLLYASSGEEFAGRCVVFGSVVFENATRYLVSIVIGTGRWTSDSDEIVTL